MIETTIQRGYSYIYINIYIYIYLNYSHTSMQIHPSTKRDNLHFLVGITSLPGCSNYHIPLSSTPSLGANDGMGGWAC